MTTFAPDTPAHVLSDWVEEHARDYGFTAERNADGELIVTVPAKDDGLPDWETFERVCHELRYADGWVMEGAEPEKPNESWRYWDWWFYENRNLQAIIPHVLGPYLSKESNLVAPNYPSFYFRGSYRQQDAALADLSRAMVAYARSLPQQGEE